jgi:phi13 family phage major tail protein
MANKVKFGLKNVYYSVITENTSQTGETTYSYATPVHIPGAVNLSVDVEGSTNPFYADNVVYYQTVANNGYSGTLEIAMIPDSFRTDVLQEQPMQNGLIAEYSDRYPKSFALAFQVDGDESNTLFWYYNCTATRPSAEAATVEENIEPQTDTLDISMRARATDALVRVKTSDTTPSATREAWFDAVVVPQAIQ